MAGESYKNIFLFLIILLVGFIICMGSTYAVDTNGSCGPNYAHINSTNVESNYMAYENLNGTTDYYNSTITTLKYGDEDSGGICCYNEESDVNNCTFEKSNDSIKYSTNSISSTSLSDYLIGSGSATITTAIKDLAISLTENCKSDLEKANALFTYVKSSISHSYYYNTKYEASGTLTNKKGNCCDKSNLLVALCRASGLAARYCHSTPSFNNGLKLGHVWTQIAVDGVWYAADTSSSSNTLGHINN